MKLYWMRACRSTEYPGIVAHAFAIGHYVDMKDGNDDFSKKMMHFYKFGNDMDFFLSRFLDIYKTYFENDKLKFDIISLVPTHEKSGINKNMQALAEKLSIVIKIPHEQILARNRAIKGSHEISTFKERYENIGGSMDVIENVSGKNIILMDNVVITGTTLLEAARVLKENGAKTVVCMSLGLGIKGKETDYYLGGNMMASELITKFTSAKIPRAQREAYKKQKDVQNA